MADLLAALLEEWQLVRDGDPLGGAALPVRTRAGEPAVLKTGAAEHEHLALTRWEGRGAVRLLRADPHRGALLLERAGAGLADAWDLEACQVVASLFAALHLPVGAPFPRLSESLAGPLDALAALPRNAPLPRRMVEQAISLGRSFARDEQTDGVMVHTDLHYGTVLRRDEGWVAISPRPLSGDPHYELAPLLLHRTEELAGDLRDGLRRRFHTLVDEADLDEDRARDWVIVRTVLRALAGGADLTLAIAVAKAVQE